MEIKEYLGNLTYPGRTIIAGKNKEGKLFYSYAIMGRSVNSRNRIFVEDKNTVKTKAFDPSLLEDPHLIIYNAVIISDDFEIFTNGDQSDTIYEQLIDNNSIEDALNKREYEDDEPNYTPRISGVFEKNGKLTLSILKRENNECKRLYFSYDNLLPSQFYIIHTYEDDGNPLPSFKGCPRKIDLDVNSAKELCTLLFNSLNKDNRISAFARCAFEDSQYLINSKE